MKEQRKKVAFYKRKGRRVLPKHFHEWIDPENYKFGMVYKIKTRKRYEQVKGSRNMPKHSNEAGI